MRLLRCSTQARAYRHLVFDEFEGQNIPPYASLSHVWDEDEVLFSHVQASKEYKRKGYKKIRCAMQAAAELGLTYIWIDTCCIDKSSSAELSEAINSMFTWYQNCSVCIVYMADVSSASLSGVSDTEFRQSRWFTRGWCLQELLAPNKVLFYDSHWSAIGTKHDWSKSISEITGIDTLVLSHAIPLSSRSIAHRMSWSAKRQTTRVEDLAYCLMGIFEVNMPLLYGEGPKAFQRLQEEIMKTSDDDSIFAWCDSAMRKETEHGLLAGSPAKFAWSRDIVSYRTWDRKPQFQVTNRGLRVELPLMKLEQKFLVRDRVGFFAVALNCRFSMKNSSGSKERVGYVALYLHRLPGKESQEYKRIYCDRLGFIFDRPENATIYISQKPAPAIKDMVYPLHYFRMSQSFHDEFTVLDVVCHDAGESVDWPDVRGKEEYLWLTPQCRGLFIIHSQPRSLSAAILFQLLETGHQFVLLLGSLTASEVGFAILEHPGMDKIDNFDTLERMFRPQPERLTYHLDESHEILIHTDCQITGNSKAYDVKMDLNPDKNHANSEELDSWLPMPPAGMMVPEDVWIKDLPPSTRLEAKNSTA